MPVHGKVPWPCPPHTGAKHDIYRRYLERWFPILLGGSNSYRSATYAEGFAGPGVYEAGEPGSPIIAMRALLGKVPNQHPLVKFLFVDDDKRCIEMLQKEFIRIFPTRPRPAETTPVKIVQGQCSDKFESALDKLDAWGKPIIAVLDSWGNAPVPSKLLRRLAKNPATEVIVTLGPQHFMRFVSKMGPEADEVFGGDPTWREIEGMTDAAQKRQHVLTCYRQSLKAAGFAYLLDFELIDHRGEALYLLFGTNHSRGVEKMKDSLWEVDPAYGIGFRDPRDEQHETLFNLVDPQLGPLMRLLLGRISEASPHGVRVDDLRQFTLHETAFRMQDATLALTKLREAGQIASGSQGVTRASHTVTAAAGA